MVLVLTGAAGSGKTTAGKALASSLSWPFLDADALHSPASVAKMRSGVPLDDADRGPWLAQVRQAIGASLAEGSDHVVACSALSAAHRAQLQLDPERVKLVRLVVPPEILQLRLEQRRDHFLGPALLGSQLDALDSPSELITLDGTLPVDVLVSRLRALVGR